MSTLEELKYKIKSAFSHFEVFIEGNEIVIEEEYDMSEDEKNDDDCFDVARENGEEIIGKFPSLEMSNYYCHRHKYAIVSLRLISMNP